MLHRLAVLAGTAGAVVAVAAAPAGAAPAHRLSIRATPNPDQAGDPVAIFGRLTGPDSGGRTVTLWHRVHPAVRFTPVQRITTDRNGFYLITRPEDVVKTNRDWFVRAAGVRSRTVHERVQAIVSLQSSTTSAVTNQRVAFGGTVTPGRPGEVVVLQRQVGGDSGTWRTISGTRTRTTSDGRFVIARRFRVPDTYTVRARFVGDRRNAAAPSDSVDVVVDQRQNPKLTLAPAANPVAVGDPVTLRGTLAGPDDAGQVVTLYAHEHGRASQVVATALTDGAGAFSFVQVPAHTTAYQVRTSDGRRSAQVFEAVRDRVTATADDTTPSMGQTVTFSGTVAPDKTGHLIELQRLGIDGAWHDVEIARVGSGSVYRVTHVMGSPGTKTFRVHIDGGAFNWGASSGPITVTVGPPAS